MNSSQKVNKKVLGVGELGYEVLSTNCTMVGSNNLTLDAKLSAVLGQRLKQRSPDPRKTQQQFPQLRNVASSPTGPSKSNGVGHSPGYSPSPGPPFSPAGSGIKSPAPSPQPLLPQAFAPVQQNQVIQVIHAGQSYPVMPQRIISSSGTSNVKMKPPQSILPKPAVAGVVSGGKGKAVGPAQAAPPPLQPQLMHSAPAPAPQPQPVPTQQPHTLLLNQVPLLVGGSGGVQLILRGGPGGAVSAGTGAGKPLVLPPTGPLLLQQPQPPPPVPQQAPQPQPSAPVQAKHHIHQAGQVVRVVAANGMLQSLNPVLGPTYIMQPGPAAVQPPPPPAKSPQYLQPQPQPDPLPPPKHKPKKKKKKEHKLDLANIMKLSGIGDEDDVMFESDASESATCDPRDSPDIVPMIIPQPQPHQPAQPQFTNPLLHPPFPPTPNSAGIPTPNPGNDLASLLAAYSLQQQQHVYHHKPKPLLLQGYPMLNQLNQGVQGVQSVVQGFVGSVGSVGSPLLMQGFLPAGLVQQPQPETRGGFKLALGEDGRLVLQHDPTLNQDLQSQLLLQSIFGINLQGGNLVLTSVNNTPTPSIQTAKPLPKPPQIPVQQSQIQVQQQQAQMQQHLEQPTIAVTKTTNIIQSAISSVKTTEQMQESNQNQSNQANNYSYIVNLTPDQLETLKRNGQLTVNGQTIFMHRPNQQSKSPKPKTPKKKPPVDTTKPSKPNIQQQEHITVKNCSEINKTILNKQIIQQSQPQPQPVATESKETNTSEQKCVPEKIKTEEEVEQLLNTLGVPGAGPAPEPPPLAVLKQEEPAPAHLFNGTVENVQLPAEVPDKPFPRVHTIQLTPQKQQLLKSVQLQIHALSARLQAEGSADQDVHVALRHLFIEQQKILASGKLLNTESSAVSSSSGPPVAVTCPPGPGPPLPAPKNNGTYFPVPITNQPQLKAHVVKPEVTPVQGPPPSAPEPPPDPPPPPPVPPVKRAPKLMYSRAQLIEQQLQTDQHGAINPDTTTPFSSKADAVKRLVRYHCFKQPVLSSRDLAKADEIFELTARHLVDKFRAMVSKYQSLLLQESMRHVQTSELMMLDRLFLAEEQQELMRMQAEAATVKTEPVHETQDRDVNIKCGLNYFTDGQSTNSYGTDPDLDLNLMDTTKIIGNFEIEINNKGQAKDEEYDEWLCIQRELGVLEEEDKVKKAGSGSIIGEVKFEVRIEHKKRAACCEASHEVKRARSDSLPPKTEPEPPAPEGDADKSIDEQVQSAIDSILNLQQRKPELDDLLS